MCIYNAYCIYILLPNPNKDKIKIREFKRHTIVSLLSRNATSNDQTSASSSNQTSSNHVLLEFAMSKISNKNSKSYKDCFLCSKQKITKYVCTGCYACKLPFCVKCFSKYHNPNLLKDDQKSLVQSIIIGEKNTNRRRHKNLEFDLEDFNLN